MKLIYIVNARIPTQRAHGMQVMKMCEAFQKQGFAVELVVPARWKNEITVDPFEYYQIAHKFHIRKLFCELRHHFFVDLVAMCPVFENDEREPHRFACPRLRDINERESFEAYTLHSL